MVPSNEVQKKRRIKGSLPLSIHPSIGVGHLTNDDNCERERERERESATHNERERQNCPILDDVTNPTKPIIDPTFKRGFDSHLFFFLSFVLDSLHFRPQQTTCIKQYLLLTSVIPYINQTFFNQNQVEPDIRERSRGTRHNPTQE